MLFKMMLFAVHMLLMLGLLVPFVKSAPMPQGASGAVSSFWVADIKRQGAPAFGPKDYQIFRNVKDYGAKGKKTHPFRHTIRSLTST
jgi:hypothetical protein